MDFSKKELKYEDLNPNQIDFILLWFANQLPESAVITRKIETILNEEKENFFVIRINSDEILYCTFQTVLLTVHNHVQNLLTKLNLSNA